MPLETPRLDFSALWRSVSVPAYAFCSRGSCCEHLFFPGALETLPSLTRRLHLSVDFPRREAEGYTVRQYNISRS